MHKFIFFTKTLWSEPPRLRHQIAELLASRGHDALFFERPLWFYQKPRHSESGQPNLHLAQHRELIHHKLRLTKFLHWLNASVTSHSIKRQLTRRQITDESVIINFNYEYYFLREIFPDKTIITIINDDHVSSALFGYERPLRHALARTCRNSDFVLTVSSPLQRKLAPYKTAGLFLPWADRGYSAPTQGHRNVLLFWGYINYRLDEKLLTALADYLSEAHPTFEILLVGPIEANVSRAIRSLLDRPNITWRAPCTLDELDLDRVVASLIPYRSNIEKIEAIELSNKALQLLARGLPLLISGMPNFVERPFIVRMDSSRESLEAALHQVLDQFRNFQPEIECFVAANSGDSRAAQLLALLEPRDSSR